MSLTGKLFLHSDETLGGIGGGLLTNIYMLLNSFFSPPFKRTPVVDEGTGQRWVFEHSRFRTQCYYNNFLCFSLAVPSVPDGAGGRVGGRRPSGECRPADQKGSLSFLHKFVYLYPSSHTGGDKYSNNYRVLWSWDRGQRCALEKGDLKLWSRTWGHFPGYKAVEVVLCGWIDL